MANRSIKLIRKLLSPEEKKKVQPLLQKAYQENPDGFYIHAPQKRGNVKEQLGYIGRYIRAQLLLFIELKNMMVTM